MRTFMCLPRHPVTDIALADHREPSQWDFYIIPSFKLLLPAQRTIALSSIIQLSSAKCHFGELGTRVEEVRDSLAHK